MSAVKNEILLESGTNEIEIMEFTIGSDIFGINVAKVTEIMMPAPVKAMPHAHPAVEGVFKPREKIITIIDLPKYLGISSEGADKTLLIVTNFNKLLVAFRVHTVVGIDRISWNAIQKPDKTIYGGTDGVATGLAEFEGRLITILDFEKIVADISPETSINVAEIDKLGKRAERRENVMVVEDSVLLAKMITECLHKAGYTKLMKYNNGQEAWDYLETIKDENNIKEKVACIITDIEMPMMDGHRLTKLVKSDKRLQEIPVIIFSSLINDEMRIKGEQLGANNQLSKPEIGRLVEAVDALMMHT